MWDFGDGMTSQRQNPSHYYYDEGVFTVSLTLTSGEGCERTLAKEDLITVGGNTLDLVVGLEEEVENNEVAVYPQPFDNFLIMNIYSRERMEVHITMHSLSGVEFVRRKVVLEVGENRIRFDAIDLRIPEGIYLIRFDSEKIERVEKVFKVIKR